MDENEWRKRVADLFLQVAKALDEMSADLSILGELSDDSRVRIGVLRQDAGEVAELVGLDWS